MALLWPAVEVIRIIAQPAHEVVFGDYALFELAARQAWHFDRLLGPNVHVGFNDPGPAMFYLLAPAVRLLHAGPGLYLGAVLINAAALVATVVFVRCQCGHRAALWAVAALNLFCWAVGLDTLRQPWNPLLIIVPMVLFIVLCAGAATRVVGAWLWAAVVGSYELQTHITTAVFVTVVLSLAGLWALAEMWRRPSPRQPLRWWRRPARLSGLGALLLIWFPSTVELFADHPNNFNKTWRWIHHGHNPGIAIRTSLGIVLRSIAISPFNHRSWGVPLPASRTEEVVGLLIFTAGAGLTIWLIRRRHRFALALAAASVVAIPVATITVSHAGGDNYAFLTAWLGFVPYLLFLALGMTLLSAPGRGSFEVRRELSVVNVTALLTALAVACACIAAVSDLRERSLATLNRTASRATSFVGDAEAQLKPGDRWIAFIIVSPSAWPIAAGVIVEMERLGYHTVVDPRFDYLFGKKRTVLHPVQALFCFYQAADPAGAHIALGHPISTAVGTVMTSWRPAG